MTLYKYTAITGEGSDTEGTIEAISRDVAISVLQRRGLIVSSVEDAEKVPFLKQSISSFDRVSNRDIVVLSRQIAALFEAQVSALKVFELLADESENEVLRKTLEEVVADLRGGNPISAALSKHPRAFSDFYVSMVRVGEESGKLQEIFLSLADFLDRTYEVTSKARNALIYPSFVVVTFIAVMILMLTTVVPKISGILEDAGQDIPVYTRVVIGVSNFFLDYGVFILVACAIGGVFLFRYLRTKKGKLAFSRFKIEIPYLGPLYRKLYLSRIADNMNTMLIAGVPMIKSIETTTSVVGNGVYEEILTEAGKAIRGGSTLSQSLSGYEEMPGIVTQMIRIGEETGELGGILQTLANFYRREVNNAVDTLVDLIEPVMIVFLGAGVGILLASVLIPIYNLSSAL